LDRYYDTSIYLPYINNELSPTQEYKDRLISLTNMGLFMWDDDEVVHPKESEWFGAYNKYRHIVPLKKSELWKEDLIGLKTLEDEGKLFFYHGPGRHMHIEEYYITDYLIPLLLDETPSPS
jgi:palmitoyl-protein thioesterase